MALHLLLYSIICHHARHASQTFHVIVFRLLTLVKMTEITVKEALHIKFKKPTINRQLLLTALHLFQMYFSLIGTNWS